jgi:opacity protein-like surface antigen
MGAILNKSHRISLSHVKYSEEDENLTLILGNYDYLMPLNDEFKLYAGVHLGKANYDSEDTEFLNSDMSGLAYGLQIGTIYEISKNVEFEFGLAYTKYNVDKSYSGTYTESYGGYSVDIDYNGKVELDKSTSMFAGINYKF